MEILCVEPVSQLQLKLRKNSKREVALEYAKGISKPNDMRFRGANMSQQDFDEDAIGYYNDGYQYQDRPDLGQLENNHNEFSNEIDKIKAMFN